MRSTSTDMGVLTERKGKAAEEQLLRAQQAGSVGLFTVDVATDEAIATPEFCRIYGVTTRERVPLREVEDLVLADDAGLASSVAERQDGRMDQAAPVPDLRFAPSGRRPQSS